MNDTLSEFSVLKTKALISAAAAFGLEVPKLGRNSEAEKGALRFWGILLRSSVVIKGNLRISSFSDMYLTSLTRADVALRPLIVLRKDNLDGIPVSIETPNLANSRAADE